MNQIKIPKAFLDVQYKSARIPGVENQSDLSLGANCQVFAYVILKEMVCRCLTTGRVSLKSSCGSVMNRNWEGLKCY